jgi:hypothetical protein
MPIETSPETLTLPPSLSIRGIGDVHDMLLSRLFESRNVVVDIPGDAETDLSFVQLMESSRLYAQTHGKTVALKNPATGRLLETLRRGGFLTDMDGASRLFWLHGKEIQ